MKEAYMKLIEDLDITIRLVSGIYVDARQEDKRKLDERINQLLDERLRLMKIRDLL